MQQISQREIKIVSSLSHKKYREQTGLFVAEGEKCIRELLPLGCEMIVISEAYDASSITDFDTHLLRAATISQFKQMSSLQTPQGVLGVFRIPSSIHQAEKEGIRFAPKLTLVLDSIQDPGNLGTIIRTACWFGVQDIVCSRGTVDAYSPKVVQATMGALAKVNITYTSLPVYLCGLPKGTPIVGTLLNGKLLQEALPTLKGKLASANNMQYAFHLVMGNEGNGISQAVQDCLTDAVLIPSIPMDRPQIESLNVAIATAILLSQLLL